MVTKKQYDSIKNIIRKEIEEENECQCDDKEYTEERRIYTTIIKYKELRHDTYKGWFSQYSFDTYLCPYCGKEYSLHVVMG